MRLGLWLLLAADSPACRGRPCRLACAGKTALLMPRFPALLQSQLHFWMNFLVLSAFEVDLRPASPLASGEVWGGMQGERAVSCSMLWAVGLSGRLCSSSEWRHTLRALHKEC